MRTPALLSCALPLAALACWGGGRGASNGPLSRAEEPVGATTPEAGIALDAASCERAAAYSERRSGRALLVMRDGEIVFERYSDWSAEKPHPLASGTKSFSGVLAVTAVSDGLFEDLDEPVVRRLPEWSEADGADPRRSRITVRNLLQLCSGLEPESDLLGPAGFGIHDLGPLSDLAGFLRKRREPPSDRFAAALEIPMAREQGTDFAYGPSAFYAFGAVLERALAARDSGPRTAFEYLRERVLLPAGIDVTLERFAPDVDGKPNLPGGGHLTAREWARFGEWVRLGGARVGADGELVRSLPEGALATWFEPSATNAHYGLTWWLLNGEPGAEPDVDTAFLRSADGSARTERVDDLDGRPLAVVMAAGAGQQRLYLIPAHGLVVVRFAEMTRRGRRYGDAAFLRLLLGLPEPKLDH